MIEQYTSKTKLPVLKINGYMCHSLYDPLKEARKFVEKNKEDIQLHFIYGYGNGYIVEEFINRIENNDTYYIIIDPFLDISNKKSDNATFLFYENVTDLRKKLESFVDWQYNRKLTLSMNYDKMDLKKYKIFLDMFNEITYLSKVNENTVRLFSNDWYENYLYNTKYVIKDDTLASLKAYTNKPVVVASGGPSLTKQLKIIKKHRSHLVLIAAGSTINSLIAENIYPDLVVSIDGNIKNYEHFKNNKFNEKVKYIYNMYSYPKIREKFQEGYYFLDSTSRALSSHLKKISGKEVLTVTGGGSVAHFALSIATFITTGPIALIGQDLAYTDGQSHAENNVFKKEINIKEKKLIPIDGYNGGIVYTDYMFLSMKNSFEELIRLLDSERIYNCTEGGALIKGYKNSTFKKFCENTSKSLTYSNDLLEKTIVKSNEIIISEINKEIKEYKKLENVTQKNIFLLKSNKERAIFNKNILRKMNNNDAIMKEICKGNPIETAFRAIEMKVNRSFKEGKEETAQEKYERIYKQNEYLYTETNKLAKRGQEILKINLE